MVLPHSIYTCTYINKYLIKKISLRNVCNINKFHTNIFFEWMKYILNWTINIFFLCRKIYYFFLQDLERRFILHRFAKLLAINTPIFCVLRLSDRRFCFHFISDNYWRFSMAEEPIFWFYFVLLFGNIKGKNFISEIFKQLSSFKRKKQQTTAASDSLSNVKLNENIIWLSWYMMIHFL